MACELRSTFRAASLQSDKDSGRERWEGSSNAYSARKKIVHSNTYVVADTLRALFPFERRKNEREGETARESPLFSLDSKSRRNSPLSSLSQVSKFLCYGMSPTTVEPRFKKAKIHGSANRQRARDHEAYEVLAFPRKKLGKKRREMFNLSVNDDTTAAAGSSTTLETNPTDTSSV